MDRSSGLIVALSDGDYIIIRLILYVKIERFNGDILGAEASYH
jgi:hypothetical protein